MKTIWIIIVSVLVSGGFFAGGTYYFAQTKFDKNKNELQIQINDRDTIISQKEEEIGQFVKSNKYENQKYGYSFLYPKSTIVGSNSFMAIATEAENIYASSLNLECFNPNLYINNPDQETKAAVSLGLKDFVTKIWEYNNNDMDKNIKNQEVGEITPVEINGSKGYSLILGGSYTGLGEGRILNYENGNLYGKHMFIFLENKGMKYQIDYPVESREAKTIVESMVFSE